jgi:hypothetical protein
MYNVHCTRVNGYVRGRWRMGVRGKGAALYCFIAGWGDAIADKQDIKAETRGEWVHGGGWGGREKIMSEGDNT